MFSTLYDTYFPFYMHCKMSSAIFFNLDQSKVFSSGNGLKDLIHLVHLKDSFCTYTYWRGTVIGVISNMRISMKVFQPSVSVSGILKLDMGDCGLILKFGSKVLSSFHSAFFAAIQLWTIVQFIYRCSLFMARTRNCIHLRVCWHCDRRRRNSDWY